MIQTIQIKNFRNISEGKISFSPKVNILIGDNGHGKSNLIEALCLLTTGQSFRFANTENLITKGKQESLLKATAIQGELQFDLQSFIMKSKRNNLLNGKKANLIDLSYQFPTVVFSPESLSAIKEGAEQRRQLIDDLIISISYKNSGLLSDFRKVLKVRNRVLKNYLSGEKTKNETLSLLESLNPLFLKHSAELTYQRILALKAISDDFNNAMQNISKKKDVDISVEYVVSGHNAINFSFAEIENSLELRARQLQEAELSSGVSLVGPHKHDIIFLYDENNSRFYCSQGQQRALILSFKMAQIVYHRRVHESYPLLLLDDVLSELDLEKQNSLIKFLSEINTQIFITTTDLTLPSNVRFEDCAVIKVREGQIGK